MRADKSVNRKKEGVNHSQSEHSIKEKKMKVHTLVYYMEEMCSVCVWTFLFPKYVCVCAGPDQKKKPSYFIE